MKILFFGDLCPTDENMDFFLKENMDVLFGDVLSLTKDKEYIFLNLECAITESPHSIKKIGPCLKAPYQTAKIIKNLGVTLVGLSNNHVFDYGKKGAEDTIKALDDSQIEHTGFGMNYEDSRKNFVMKNRNEKVAVLAVCEHEYSYALADRMGSRPFDPYDTLDDIREAKRNAEKVVVIYHGGKEYSPYPSPRLHKQCHAMATAGADVILCQHSHCIGGYEKYKHSHILYGQGNFLFTRHNHPIDIRKNALAVVYDTISNEMAFTPLITTKTGVTLAKDEQREHILSLFKTYTLSLQDGTWKQGWEEFCRNEKPNYLKIFRQENTEDTPGFDAMFAHYLDCEAHTDVLKESFPSSHLTNEI
ncbi:CapA family protein [Kiritimatiellota bacterium B12222]|nr:CapA family protein [Kiritimatiellota bacterium B12222]